MPGSFTSVVAGIGLQLHDYGTHSLRRTKASIIYKAMDNLGAVQMLLGHAKIDSTVRYIGVDVEDALELAERTEVLADPRVAIRELLRAPYFGRSFREAICRRRPT